MYVILRHSHDDVVSLLRRSGIEEGAVGPTGDDGWTPADIGLPLDDHARWEGVEDVLASVDRVAGAQWIAVLDELGDGLPGDTEAMLAVRMSAVGAPTAVTWHLDEAAPPQTPAIADEVALTEVLRLIDSLAGLDREPAEAARSLRGLAEDPDDDHPAGRIAALLGLTGRGEDPLDATVVLPLMDRAFVEATVRSGDVTWVRETSDGRLVLATYASHGDESDRGWLDLTRRLQRSVRSGESVLVLQRRGHTVWWKLTRSGDEWAAGQWNDDWTELDPAAADQDARNHEALAVAFGAPREEHAARRLLTRRHHDGDPVAELVRVFALPRELVEALGAPGPFRGRARRVIGRASSGQPRDGQDAAAIEARAPRRTWLRAAVDLVLVAVGLVVTVAVIGACLTDSSFAGIPVDRSGRRIVAAISVFAVLVGLSGLSGARRRRREYLEDA